MYFTISVNNLKHLISFLFLICCSAGFSYSQQNRVLFNTNFVYSNAVIKDSWNTFGKPLGYKPVNGFSCGMTFLYKYSEERTFSNGISIDLFNYGLESNIRSNAIKSYQKFTILRLSQYNSVKLYKGFNLNFYPNLNYLFNIDSFIDNGSKRIRSNNFFGRGYAKEDIYLRKFTVDLSLGLSHQFRKYTFKINRNNALQYVAKAKSNDPDKLYLSNWEFGVSGFLFDLDLKRR